MKNKNQQCLNTTKKSTTDIIPLYVPTERREKTVRLYSPKKSNESHYRVINMSALVSNMINRNKDKKHVCDYCLNHFGSPTLLESHTEYCIKRNAVNTICLEAGKYSIKFRSIQDCALCSIKIYADFRSFLRPNLRSCSILCSRA